MRFDSSKTGNSVVVQELDFAINLVLYGLLLSLGNQYIEGSLSWPSLKSAGNPLILTMRSMYFLSASQIIFPSYRPDPLLLGHRRFDRFCALFPRPYWYVEIIQRGFEGVFEAFLLTTLTARSLL